MYKNGNNIKIKIIERPEPWLIPKIYGDAISFFVIVWNINPEHDKLIPANRPTKNLGNLISQIIKDSFDKNNSLTKGIFNKDYMVSPKILLIKNDELNNKS